MIIEVCSRVGALERVKTVTDAAAVISITSLEEKDVEFERNAQIISILHLKFNDLKEEVDEEGIPYGRPLPKPENFKGLKAFPENFEGLKAFADDLDRLGCERLIIHCNEGVSRSAALAQAVFRYRGGRDEVKTQRPPDPNPLVYELACRELGLF